MDKALCDSDLLMSGLLIKTLRFCKIKSYFSYGNVTNQKAVPRLPNEKGIQQKYTHPERLTNHCRLKA